MLFAWPTGVWAAGGETTASVPIWLCIPFAGLLLCIAIMPLIKAEWWEAHQPHVVLMWIILMVVPFAVVYGVGDAAETVLDCIINDYLTFIILLFGLFCVSGNITMEGDFAGSPRVNVCLLAFGTLLSSCIGTTGASMLMVRPVIKMNSWRKRKSHIMVFFIFMVSNMGGCLTPIGDPPLLMGFMRGVPFFWSLHLLPVLLFNMVIMLFVFYHVDKLAYRKDIAQGRKPDISKPGTEFHIDGLRVDAVASMLYLDYGKSDGEWLPNKDGGNEHYEAIHFLQHLNSEVEKEHPGAYIIAEESTAWPGVTAPVADGGLGFSYKWNMGWMNDFLEYMKLDPYFRKDHQRQLCFSIDYYTSEKYILVLSHDEVVHGKCSLLNKMSGLEGDKFASLRAAFGFMYGHPGKKLLFMGQEFAQKREWAEFRSLDWFLLEEDDRHKKMQDYVRELNHLYQKYDALYYHDFNVMGFEWMDCWRPELSTVAFVRRGSSVKDQLMFIANFTPIALEDYQVNAPCAGTFTEILNSDEERFGGEGRVNKKPIQAKPCKAPVVPRPGEKIEPGKKYYELELYVPPLSVVVLRYDYKAE